MSPFCEGQLLQLLSVLQVGETLKGKLAEDGKLKVEKKEIRALVAEVADFKTDRSISHIFLVFSKKSSYCWGPLRKRLAVALESTRPVDSLLTSSTCS